MSFLLAEVDDARQIGRYIGMATVFLAGITWIVALSKRLGRPEHNRKCLWSFILILTVWILGGVGQVLDGAGIPKAFVIAGLIMPVIVLVAMVLAVQGWLEAGKVPPETRPRGRGYAVSTCIIGLIIFAGFAFGVLRGMDRRAAAAEQPTASDPSPGEAIRVEEFNFGLRMPSGRWSRLEPKSINPIACLALNNRKLDSYLVVVAERQPGSATVTLPALTELVKSRVRSQQDGTILSEQPHALGRLEGILVESEFQINELSVASSTWVHTGPEHLYQVVYWGNRKDWPALRQDRDAVLAGFAPLRKPVPPAAPAEPDTPPLRDEARNFSFRTPPKPWVPLDPTKLEGEACLAYHQAPLNAFFMLVHEKLDDGDLPTVESLAEVVRARIESMSDSGDIGKPQERRIGGLQGLQIDADVVVGAQTLTYRVWLHSRKGHQYQLFTWGLRSRREDVRREAELFFPRFSVLDRTENEQPDDF